MTLIPSRLQYHSISPAIADVSTWSRGNANFITILEVTEVVRSCQTNERFLVPLLLTAEGLGPTLLGYRQTKFCAPAFLRSRQHSNFRPTGLIKALREHRTFFRVLWLYIRAEFRLIRTFFVRERNSNGVISIKPRITACCEFFILTRLARSEFKSFRFSF